MIYTDNAATTPLSREVLEEMIPYLTECYGNASSIYSIGREARSAIDKAREKIANLLGVKANEIYFTSGGSEADNWAIKGVAYANNKKGKHIITSAIEHHAVLHTCQYLEKQGFKVTYLPVDQYGMVSPADLEAAITDETILVTIMQANNEIGTIQPIKELAEIAHAHKIYFHTDAVQAVGHIPVSITELGADLLSLSGHKFEGPKGVGVLYIKGGTRITQFMHGGAQERGKRATTENVAGIVGIAKALEIAYENMDKNVEKITALRDRFISRVLEEIPHCRLNGHPEVRLPGNANISFSFIEGEALLLSLDMVGIAVQAVAHVQAGH